MTRRPPSPTLTATLCPYTTPFRPRGHHRLAVRDEAAMEWPGRSEDGVDGGGIVMAAVGHALDPAAPAGRGGGCLALWGWQYGHGTSCTARIGDFRSLNKRQNCAK